MDSTKLTMKFLLLSLSSSLGAIIGIPKKLFFLLLKFNSIETNHELLASQEIRYSTLLELTIYRLFVSGFQILHLEQLLLLDLLVVERAP